MCGARVSFSILTGEVLFGMIDFISLTIDCLGVVLFDWLGCLFFFLKCKDCSFVSPLYVLLTENWKLECQIFYRSGILETCMALR